MKRFDDDARQEAHKLLDIILDIGDEVHPKNQSCEAYRTPEAQRATRLFWLLHRDTLAWAADIHLADYLRQHVPGVQEKMEAYSEAHCPGRDDVDWVLEVIGGSLRADCYDWEDYFDDTIEEFSDIYFEDIDSPEADLHVVYEMTQTTRLWGYWFDRLHESVFELIVGGQPQLLKPTKQRRGDAVRVHWARRQIILAVLYLHGAGASKREAREKVGSAVGVSEHALKKWEIELRKLGLVDFLCEAAELAGRWQDGFSEHEHLGSVREHLGEDGPEHAVHYGQSYLEAAWWLNKNYREMDFDKMRAALRTARASVSDT